MSATTSQTHNGPRTYGNWTRPKSPGLLGLGAIGTVVLFVGAGITIIVSIIGGLLAGFVVAVATIGFLLLIALRDKHGQSTLARTATRLIQVCARTPQAWPPAVLRTSAASASNHTTFRRAGTPRAGIGRAAIRRAPARRTARSGPDACR